MGDPLPVSSSLNLSLVAKVSQRKIATDKKTLKEYKNDDEIELFHCLVHDRPQQFGFCVQKPCGKFAVSLSVDMMAT